MADILKNDFGRHFTGKSLLYLKLLILGLYLSGCRSIAPVVTDDREYSRYELYENLRLHNSGIDKYSAGRINISITEGDEQMDLRAAVRIRRDSAIMLSVNAFAGIEAARLLITPDSVKVIDRINNRYFLGNYRDASRIFNVPLDFNILQGLFLGYSGSFFEAGFINSHEHDSYRFNEGKIRLKLQPGDYEGIPQDALVGFEIDDRFLIRSIDFHSSEINIYAGLKFLKYTSSEGYLLPNNISLYFVSHNIPLKADIEISRIETGRTMSFPFSIPARYLPF